MVGWKRMLNNGFSGKDDFYNTIEGLLHGGAAQTMRKSMTDFGSGWNALRGLARAGETFAEMTASKGFQQSIKEAKQIGSLGKGQFGEALEMRGKFRGQEFGFARKIGDIGEHEVAALKATQETVGPSVYASRPGAVDMEMFTGTTLAKIDPAKLEGAQGQVKKAFSAMHSAGFEHADPHLGNIMLTGEGKVGLVDFGKSRRLAGTRAFEAAAGDIDIASKLMKARISGTSQLAAIDPFAAAWDNNIAGFDDAYNTIEGLAHGGSAQEMRKKLTEFGSGWRGLFTAGVLTPMVGYGIFEAATAVPKHQLLGMSYIAESEEELYERLTRPQGGGFFSRISRDLIDEEEEFETAATVGTAFHEYIETLQMARGDVAEIEKYIYSKKHGLAGYADLIYHDGTVSDAKSVGSKVFEQVKDRGAPLQKHFEQVNTYAILNESRKGRIDYYLRDDPSQKMTYEWEASQEAFDNTMAKVDRVRSRISADIASGKIDPDTLGVKRGITAQRISDVFVGHKYSFDAGGVSEALQNFVIKREQYHKDRSNSTLQNIERFNTIDRMSGNQSEQVFRAAHQGGRRHNNMGYSY